MAERKTLIVWMVIFAFLWAPGLWAKNSNVEAEKKSADQMLVNMAKTADQLETEKKKAKKENHVARLNCLTRKSNLVQGLVKASERARSVILEAVSGEDSEIAAVYKKKLGAYGDQVDEVGRSVGECFDEEIEAEEGTSLVYIHPGGEEIEEVEVPSPWDFDYDVSGGDGLPPVPAASPFQ